MTTIEKAILQALLEYGSMTWYRLDPIVSALNFTMGRPFDEAIKRLETFGLLVEMKQPGKPSLLSLTGPGLAFLQSSHVDFSKFWEQLAQQAIYRDSADSANGPRALITT